MQITELKAEGLKSSYQLTVDAATIGKETETELREAGSRIKIPGFRPGQIPLKILQQRYGKAVQGDVLKRVINHATQELISKKQLRPALMPQINVTDYKEGSDLSFTVTVESLPPVPEMDYKNIKIEKLVYDISDDDVEEGVVRIAERVPHYERRSAGSKAQSGDALIIDFKGMQNGEVFEGGTAEGFRLVLGSGQFIDGFEDQLLGASEGETRNLNVTFPKKYHSEALAGKPAVFEVKVHEILAEKVPAVNEEFAKSRGFADLRGMREAVRDQMKKDLDNVARDIMKKALFDHLEDAYHFEVPQSMVDVEFSAIWRRIEDAKAEGNEIESDKTPDELRAEYRKIAERRVRLGIILAELGHRNNLQVMRDELSRAVMRHASMFPGQERRVVEYYQSNPDRLEDLRGPLLEEKAVDFIFSKLEMKERKLTVRELTEYDQENSEEEGDVTEKPARKATAKKKKKE